MHARSQVLWVLLIAACSHEQHVGRPDALRPILGGRGVAAHVPRTTANEPVENLLIPVAPLRPAWPEVAEQLPGLIRTLIARGSWNDEHHQVVEEDGLVLVRHRPAVIPQVRALVEGLRARLLRPLQLEAVFVELTAESAPTLVASLSGREGGTSTRELDRLVAAGTARVHARAQLVGYAGQWMRSERLDNQAVVAGYNDVAGTITPRQLTLPLGHSVQAAVWRWGDERAVVAMTALYTGAAAASGPTVSQTLFRELPRQKDTEHQWEPHESRVQLPIRDVIEFRGQLTVARGRWTIASLMPRDGASLCAVLLRATWVSAGTAPPNVDPLTSRGFVLDVIPVSMPTEVSTERPVVWRVENGMEMAASSEGVKKRARRYQDEQQEQTYNFVDDAYLGRSGMSQISKAAPSKPSKSSSVHYDDGETSSAAPAETGPAMPDQIEALRMEVTQAEWPEGTALEFVANHVFVVHSPEVAGKVRRLLERTHAWRNQPIAVETRFPLLAPDSALLAGDAERCGSAVEATGGRHSTAILPAGYVLARPGTWAEMFAGEIHGVLADAWPPDRSSPSLVAYWKGSRLEIQPQDAHDGARRLQLRWYHHRLEHTTPETKTGAVFQSPVTGTWTVDQTVDLRRGCVAVIGAHAIDSRRELQAVQVRLGTAPY